jgi:hypothetical protein
MSYVSQEQRLQAFIDRLSPEQQAKFSSKINEVRGRIEDSKMRYSASRTYTPPESTYDYSRDYTIRPKRYERDDGIPKPESAPATAGGGQPSADRPAERTEGDRETVDEVLSEEEKKKRQDQVDSSAKGTLLAKSFTANTKKLTNTEIEKAHLVRGSKIFSKTGSKEAVRSYLDSKGMQDFEIDDLTNDDALVTTSPDGTDISFRGTNKTNISEWKTNADILIGQQADNPKFKNARSLYDRVKAKYPNSEIHTSGHSLGGALASDLGNFHDIPATLFNPHMGLGGTLDPKAKQTLLRTTTDAASLGTALTKTGNNVEIKTINPLEHSLNPTQSHRLDNFTDQSSSRPTDNLAETHLKNIIDRGAKAAEATLLDASEESVDSGMTFSDHLSRFNNGPNTRDNVLDADGNSVLSEGLNAESGLVRAWNDASGTFTEGEVNSLLDNKQGVFADQDQPATEARHKELTDKISDIHDGPNDIGMTRDERTDYLNSDAADRKDFVDENIESGKESMDAMDTFSEHAETANPGMMDNFKTAIHPSALAHGLLAGYAANKVINIVDPDSRVPEFWRTGLEGGASGIASGLLAGGLGVGEASSLALEGGAGVVGYETQKYSRKGLTYLEDKAGLDSKSELGSDLADVGSDIVGGGAAGLVVGGVPGMVIGMGVGALAGAATSIFHHFF